MDRSPTTTLQTTKEWEQFLAGTLPGLRTRRSVLSLIPRAPRCKLCNSPFAGVGGRLMRLIGKAPWERNPRVCDFCGNWLAKQGAGGAELELTLLFADVRGSTTLAASMTPSEYARVINRFFRVGTDVFGRYEAILDQLVVSKASSAAASLDVAELEERRLELKGIPEPVGARVLRADPRFL